MNYESIRLEKKNSVAILSFATPENMNALTEQLMAETRDALRSIQEDTGIRAVILTGSGKAFMAGANLKAVGDLSVEENAAYNGRILEVAYDISHLRVPVIAAVNGYAFGGGMELALACTFRVASEKAKMGLPEVGLGLLPGAGGTQRLPRLIPMGQALKLMLTGDTITAQEAYRMGIVDKVAAPEELLPVCLAVAEKIASKSPLAVEALKDSVINGMDLPLEDALAYTCEKLRGLTATEDFKEGVAAFLEKRQPVFHRE